MSLTRKFLSSLGLEADKIEEVITAHTETVTALKDQITTLEAERDKLKDESGKYPETLKELNDLKAKVAESADKDYDALKEEYEKYKADVAAEKTREAKKAAYTEVLKDAGIKDEKHLAKVLKYTDLDSMELDKDGKIKDAKKAMDAVKEEWPEYIATEGTIGAKTATPPSNNGTSGFANMSLAEQMEYANAHPEDPSVKAWLDSDLTAKES